MKKLIILSIAALFCFSISNAQVSVGFKGGLTMATQKFNTLKKRLAEDLKLAGYRKRTRETYLERVCSLANYYDQCPSK